jgi:hypothetical protein
MKDDAPLDVDRLAECCGVRLYEDQFDGFLGLWFKVGETHAVVLEERQIPTRRRFTLAHELGHACIPRHARSLSLRCLAADLSGADPDKTTEREANEFAAELLAPRHLVGPMLTTGSISLAKGQEIADRFDISLTAGARRVVEWAGEAAALVLCENGHVMWSIRRNGFPYGLPGKGDPIPPGTPAAYVLAGEVGALEPQEIEAIQWLREGEGQRSLTLLESAVRLGDTGQVLSLLWIPDLE